MDGSYFNGKKRNGLYGAPKSLLENGHSKKRASSYRPALPKQNGKYIPTSSLMKRHTDEPSATALEHSKVRKTQQVKPKQEQANMHEERLNNKDTAPQKKISFSHYRGKRADLAKLVVKEIQLLPDHTDLQKLKLRNCDVTAEDLDIIHKGSAKNPPKIAILNFSGNKNLDLKGVAKLVKRFQSDTLDLSETQLDARQIKDLKNIRVRTLILNHKAFDHESITTSLASLVRNGLEVLSLADSKITDGQLLAIAQDAGSEISLRALNLSHVTLGTEGVNAVATFVNKTKGMEELVLSDCKLSTSSLENLQAAIQKSITALDISSNRDVRNGDVKTLAALADKVECEKLDISGNALSDEHLTQLLGASPPKKVRTLSISETPRVSVAKIADLVIKWNIRDLDASECRLSSEEIEELASCLGTRVLQRIDVTDSNEVIGERKKQALDLLRNRCEELACRE